MVRVRPSNNMATQLRNRESREGRVRTWQGGGLGYFREGILSEVTVSGVSAVRSACRAICSKVACTGAQSAGCNALATSVMR